MSSVKTIQFEAEIKQTNSRTAASLDKIYKLVLETNDVALMDLSTLPALTTVKVTVELAE